MKHMQIDVKEGDVYVVWASQINQRSSAILLNVSPDNGSSFLPAVQVNNETCFCDFPVLSITSSGFVFIAL